MSDPGPLAEPISAPLEAPQDTEREPFWGWTDVALFAAGAPIVLAAVAVLIFAAGKTLHWRMDKAIGLLAMQGLLYLVAYGLLWLILIVRYSNGVWSALRWAVAPATGARLFAAGFALALAMGLLGLAFHTPTVDNPVMRLMRDPASILVVIVFASTLGPVAEEVVFRGFLQPVAIRTLGTIAGIAGTSLLFAALHGFEYQWHWQYLLLVFIASCAFGWTRLRWNSTGASTLLHSGYNLLFFMGYLLQGRTSPPHG